MFPVDTLIEINQFPASSIYLAIFLPPLPWWLGALKLVIYMYIVL